LLELGVVRGETITLQRAAPLGDPLEYVVKGYHLSLRKREAATITVEALEAAGESVAA
jgi:Fe2+ transport system protein FeoA